MLMVMIKVLFVIEYVLLVMEIGMVIVVMVELAYGVDDKEIGGVETVYGVDREWEMVLLVAVLRLSLWC